MWHATCDIFNTPTKLILFCSTQISTPETVHNILIIDIQIRVQVNKKSPHRQERVNSCCHPSCAQRCYRGCSRCRCFWRYDPFKFYSIWSVLIMLKEGLLVLPRLILPWRFWWASRIFDPSVFFWFQIAQIVETGKHTHNAPHYI